MDAIAWSGRALQLGLCWRTMRVKIHKQERVDACQREENAFVDVTKREPDKSKRATCEIVWQFRTVYVN